MKFPEGLKLLTDTLRQIEDKKDFIGVIEDILSPGEITEISDRILILKMIKEGISQRGIAEQLGVSITTVSRGSRLLQYDRKSIQKYI